MPYWSREYDPVWAAAQAHGLPVFIHVATGGVNVKDDKSQTATTVRGLMTAMNMGKGQLTDAMVSSRSMGGGNTGSASPQRILAHLVSGGVCERFPDLHFTLVEFSAGWLVSYLGAWDKSWRRGTGQDPDWWLGFWDDSRPPSDQPAMGRLFAVNDRWPWPLKPSEYVQRQIHVQFADDPTAVKARHITGLSTVVWGNDYPHAEGTFRSSEECVAENFEGVPDEDRAAILGGTLAAVAGFDPSVKLAPAP
jgi:predicted TIM-barrel fold metal-dependent hydrolase